MFLVMFLNEEPPRSTRGRRALARAPRKLMAGAWRGGSRGAAGRAPTPAPAPSVRRNGPYTLGVVAGVTHRRPYGTLPRRLLA